MRRGATCCCCLLLLPLLPVLRFVVVPRSTLLHSMLPNWSVYYEDWVKHQAGGVQYHLTKDTDGDGVVTHARKDVYLRYEVVERRLRELPQQLDTEGGPVHHLPALAENDINPAVYEGLSEWPSIALGTSPKPHRLLRGFLNTRVSKMAPSSLWSADALRDSASAFLTQTPDELPLLTAACAWVDVELWRIILDLKITREYATRYCTQYQMAFLLHAAILPKWYAAYTVATGCTVCK